MEAIGLLLKLIQNYVVQDCPLGSHPELGVVLDWSVAGRHIMVERYAGIPGLIAHEYQGNKTIACKCQSPVEVRQQSNLGRWSAIVEQLGDTGWLFDWYHGKLMFIRRGAMDESFDQYRGMLQGLRSLLRYTFECQVRRDHALIQRASRDLWRAMTVLKKQMGLADPEFASMMHADHALVSRIATGDTVIPPECIEPWGESLGVLSRPGSAIVRLRDVTPEFIESLRGDPQRLHNLTPAQFERFTAERLDRMGYDVTLIGKTTTPDGGIDLIAVPKIRTAGAFLLAVQVKHHRNGAKVTRADVERMLAWKDGPFQIGLMVTNTDFTRNAKWVASINNNDAFIRLRGFEDLKRWLADNFWHEDDWREIPEQIQLAPSLIIRIPKPQAILRSDSTGSIISNGPLLISGAEPHLEGSN